MAAAAEFDAAALAKVLLRRSRQGALATLTPDSGDPYCSLVNVASHPDGSPILLVSRLALHTRNILADPRASLMLDERGQGDAPGDPLEGARIMVAARAVPAGDDEKALLRRRYLAAHPSAEDFIDFPDFLFVRLVLAGVHLVAGFGRIVDLAPAQVLTDLAGADAVLEAEAGAVAHMNADHRDAMNLYATRLLGAADDAWLCTGLDPAGIDLQAGRRVLRLDFPERVTDAMALRRMLVRLADQARAKTAD